MNHRSILVCDSDLEFIGALQDKSSTALEILTASSNAEAQKIISNPNNRLVSVCINQQICEPVALPLIRLSREHRPETPLSLLLNADKKLNFSIGPEELSIDQIFAKPVTPVELLQRLAPKVALDFPSTISAGKPPKTQQSEDFEDANMQSIEAETLLFGTSCFFDVFLKLPNKKFVKILKAREKLDLERVASFIRKGVKQFYIRKEAHLHFLQFCDSLTEYILNQSRLPNSNKQEQVQKFGLATYKFLSTHGISEQSLQLAGRFVTHSHRLASELDLRKLPELQGFIKLLKESDHTAGTTMIVSLILDALDFRDQDVISLIGLGSFLHDIGLLQLPPDLKETATDKFTNEQKQAFETHPSLGGRMLEAVPNVNPLIVQIIQQHHERRNRHGFPSKLGAGAIAPAAEIVGIAEVMQTLIEKNGLDPTVNPLEEMERVEFNNFSYQTVDGFRKAFAMKKFPS